MAYKCPVCSKVFKGVGSHESMCKVRNVVGWFSHDFAIRSLSIGRRGRYELMARRLKEVGDSAN